MPESTYIRVEIYSVDEHTGRTYKIFTTPTEEQGEKRLEGECLMQNTLPKNYSDEEMLQEAKIHLEREGYSRDDIQDVTYH
ncbi:hypothetical protein [Nissabacter sp. SGAir0207]|uniref:hypothetical protein n=1 Tax=Nissabacter sp. SGAir0207 TaxID=2126321 RepID=UPI0010CCD578|nr:hypothetical protein [Nissabacter sp. SGAir0207]QCR38575.1 hypothetical protein C1N62_20850 [Nissabacter sp. SGAir0207]